MKKVEETYEDESDDCSNIQLNAFMEKETFSIRSMLDGSPIYEISGKYSDGIIKSIMKSIYDKTANELILSLFDKIVKEKQRVFPCTIYDSRSEKIKTQTIFLTRKATSSSKPHCGLLKSRSSFIDPSTLMLVM